VVLARACGWQVFVPRPQPLDPVFHCPHTTYHLPHTDYPPFFSITFPPSTRISCVFMDIPASRHGFPRPSFVFNNIRALYRQKKSHNASAVPVPADGMSIPRVSWKFSKFVSLSQWETMAARLFVGNPFRRLSNILSFRSSARSNALSWRGIMPHTSPSGASKGSHSEMCRDLTSIG